MRGELIGVWGETWNDIWFPLINREDVPEDIFCELYRELISAMKKPPIDGVLVDIIESPKQSLDAFKSITSKELNSEQKLVDFFEHCYETIEDLGGDCLSNIYFNQLASFIDKFSLRYDLRRPCILCPTLPGVFSSLVRDIHVISNHNAHTRNLMKDFEEAVRDLRYGCTDTRIKTCINKEIMLLEGLGTAVQGVTGNTLGVMCDELRNWPHATIKEALKKIHGFSSDYPGIRHGGNQGSAMRPIEMRDFIAISIILTGFVPYFGDHVNAETVYRG